MIRPHRLFRALVLVAAYLLAVEGVVASAAAGAHAARTASVESLAVLCGAAPGAVEPGAQCACDDLCRLAVAAALETPPPAVGAPAALAVDASGPERRASALGAPRRSGLARGPPAASV